jgi:hypothetical protein
VRRGRPAGYRHIGLECRWQGGLVRLLESAEDLVDPDRFHVNGVRLIVFVLAEQRNCVFPGFVFPVILMSRLLPLLIRTGRGRSFELMTRTSPRCEHPAITASFLPSW